MTLVKASKRLSFLLRHCQEPLFVDLDGGWASVGAILGALGLTRAQLDEIVATDAKGRYAFDATGSKIRANQGHSIPGVVVKMERPEPPKFLYHGTATRFLDDIMHDGLNPMSRQWVHISPDFETAVNVGKRHGRPVVLVIRAREFVADGYELYLSANGVWQAKMVPAKYFEIQYVNEFGAVLGDAKPRSSVSEGNGFTGARDIAVWFVIERRVCSMKLEDMQGLLGHTVHVLRVGQIFGTEYGNYAYRIYPTELTIQEIRLGEARRESDKEFYGPGFITWLCRHDNGYVLAASPVGDEILANSCIAGRNTRVFLDRDGLYQEAEVLKDCVLKNYKHVSRVEICLPACEAALDERVQDACTRANEAAGFVVDRRQVLAVRDGMCK